MNQGNPDLEAQFISHDDEDYYVEDNESSSERSHDDRERAPRPTAEQESSTDFDSNPRFNMLSILISSCKIIASSVILTSMSHPCISMSQIWVFCMLVHDIFSISIVTLRLRNIYALDRANSNRIQQAEENNNGARDQPGNSQREQELDDIPDEERREELTHRQQLERAQAYYDSYTTMNHILKSMKRIKMLGQICIWFWAGLFVTGICIHTFLDTTGCSTPTTDYLLFAYLILASIWLFSPILILVIGCICLPVLILLMWFIGRPKPANTAAIKKLPVIKYSPDLPGDKECVICMVEYKEGDKIVTLNCNSKHYFHEACGKKWFKINGQCPMCRERIDQRKENSPS